MTLLNRVRVRLLVAFVMILFFGVFHFINPRSDYTYRALLPIATSDEMLFFQFGHGEFDADDTRFLDFIRSHISRPSNRPRRLTDSSVNKHYSQYGQSKTVDKLLNGRRNGFFIECGAANGEVLSNSLFFELTRNWTGLLIEANPEYYKSLLVKNRNALVMHGCIGPTNKPSRQTMRMAKLVGGINDLLRERDIKSYGLRDKPIVSVSCLPLNSIMTAIGVSHVDYMSLDVEGAELSVLKTVDWNRLRIDVLTIEYNGDAPTLAGIRQLFSSTGLYKEVGTLNATDVIFVRI